MLRRYAFLVVLQHDYLYKVINKSLQDFRPLRYGNRDGHAEGEHVNRGRGTLSFCLTLQVLDMSALLCLSVLVVAQPSSEVPERLMNYSVFPSRTLSLKGNHR